MSTQNPQGAPLSPRSRREWTRPITKNLRSLNQATWGFVIFRTVYTPESDTRFPVFLERLGAYVKESIDAELRPTPYMAPSTQPALDSAPNEEMKRRFVNEVVQDRALDGAGTDEVRAAFTRWLEGRGVHVAVDQLYAQHRVCIMVDDEVLTSVAAAPEDPSQDYDLEAVWVKVVEYLAPEESEWPGWLKVALSALNYFWFNIFAGEEVEDMYEAAVEEGSDVFSG
ncbi:hypothetical protein PVAG01_05922 [Phlyctema vagabunda]|uniref:Uncharacterized protein n=1 Tax=Phlyctema vagabunda TaxID=108571 RepID=A0ABR4PEL4_9HELO